MHLCDSLSDCRIDRFDIAHQYQNFPNQPPHDLPRNDTQTNSQSLMGGWYQHYSFRCQPVDYSDDPIAIRVSLYLLHLPLIILFHWSFSFPLSSTSSSTSSSNSRRRRRRRKMKLRNEKSRNRWLWIAKKYAGVVPILERIFKTLTGALYFGYFNAIFLNFQFYLHHISPFFFLVEGYFQFFILCLAFIGNIYCIFFILGTNQSLTPFFIHIKKQIISYFLSYLPEITEWFFIMIMIMIFNMIIYSLYLNEVSMLWVCICVCVIQRRAWWGAWHGSSSLFNYSNSSGRKKDRKRKK